MHQGGPVDTERVWWSGYPAGVGREAQPFPFPQTTNTPGGGFNIDPSINAAGTRIAFRSTRDLTPGSPGNADGNQEIYLASSPEAESIPTLSEWAQLGMVLILVGVAVWRLRRRSPSTTLVP